MTLAERARTIEAAFRTHPAVRDVRVTTTIGPAAEPQLSCWIVADDAALEPVSTSDAARVKKWGKVFDLLHGAPKPNEPVPLPMPAWTSTFTRQPFPPEVIEEWVDATVALVRSFSPSRVLELGCGSGVLVSRLAPACAQYVGTDLSGRSLETLARYLSTAQPPLQQVRLIERPADDFEGFADDAFDTVIVNSVVQYFPNEAYLRRVIEGAVRVVRPGGAVLLGDVRDLSLLEPFVASLELHRAAVELPVSVVHDRVRRRLAALDELVLGARFFTDLSQQLGKVARVEVRPKRGHFTNEFSAYRFEVVLRVGAASSVESSADHWRPREVAWLEWTPEWTLEAIAARLAHPLVEPLAFLSVANARVERDVAAWRAVEARACATVADLRGLLAQQRFTGLSPEAVHGLAERAGLTVELSLAAGRSDGAFDVVFARSPTPVAFPLAPPDTKAFNDPSRNVRRQALSGALVSHAQARLDAGSMPASITVVDELPRE